MPEIRSLLIGLLLFSGVIVGMSIFYGDLTDDTNLAAYGLTAGQIANISPEDLGSMSVANEITQQTKDIEDTFKQPIGNTPLDLAYGYINAGLNALTLPLAAVNLFSNMVADISDFLHLPAWVSGVIIGVISLIIIFEILSAYLKWRI